MSQCTYIQSTGLFFFIITTENFFNSTKHPFIPSFSKHHSITPSSKYFFLYPIARSLFFFLVPIIHDSLSYNATYYTCFTQDFVMFCCFSLTSVIFILKVKYVQLYELLCLFHLIRVNILELTCIYWYRIKGHKN